MTENYYKARRALVVELNAGSTPEGAADAVARLLSNAELVELAQQYLAEIARGMQRADTLRAERAAMARERRQSNKRRAALNTEIYGEPDPPMEVIWKSSQERIKEIMDEYAVEKHMEWTSDLLASPFALRDGTLTTWGSATVEQHQERCDLFAASTQASAEGYARHAEAISTLKASGVTTLNEYVMAVHA